MSEQNQSLNTTETDISAISADAILKSPSTYILIGFGLGILLAWGLSRSKIKLL